MAKGRTSFSYNAALVWQQLKIAPWWSAAIIGGLAIASSVQAVLSGYSIVGVIGTVLYAASGALWFKGMALLGGFQFLYGIEYPGSKLKSSILVNVFFVIFAGAVFYGVFPEAVAPYEAPPVWLILVFIIFILCVFAPLAAAVLNGPYRQGRTFKGIPYFRRQIGLE